MSLWWLLLLPVVLVALFYAACKLMDRVDTEYWKERIKERIEDMTE